MATPRRSSGIRHRRGASTTFAIRSRSSALRSGQTSKLANARTQGTDRLVDIAIGDLPTLTLAISAATKMPTRIIQMTDSPTMGDTAVALAFSDYRPVNGVQLPTRLTAWTDRWPGGDIRIQHATVDGDVGDLAAPAAVASARPPAGRGRGRLRFPIEAQEIAKGVWFHTGTTHHSLIVEFSDHLAVIEANNSERVAAVWAKAKELRPNKPITTLIVSASSRRSLRRRPRRGGPGRQRDHCAREQRRTYLNEMLKRPAHDQSGHAGEAAESKTGQDHRDRGHRRRQGRFDDDRPVSHPRQLALRLDAHDVLPGGARF